MHITQPESIGFSSERLGRIRAGMQGYIDRQQMAGMITLVARRGQVVHLECQGWMDREAGKPMELDTIFRIYSMTKPITSTAVMMLLEEGHFQLSDPISRFIPAFKETKVCQPRRASPVDYDLVVPQREINIRDLLTHTSGLSYGFEEKSIVDDIIRKELWEIADAKPEIDLASLIDILAGLPLASHPGTAWRYSLAIDVLGRLVEVVSGQALDTFFKTRIFDPLGMPDTDFYVPPEKYDRLAAVYGPAKNGGIEQIEPLENSPYKRPKRWFSGGGGLVSTTADYYRFAQMILNRGILEGVRLLSPKTVELMLLNHLPKGVEKLDEPWCGFGLGGAVIIDVAGSQMLNSAGSWGWGGAANTWFQLDPQEGISMILMTQYMPGFDLPIAKDFSNLVYQALVE